MNYTSTRDPSVCLEPADILLSGTSPDGGLYIPVSIPVLSPADLRNIAQLPYAEAAFNIMAPFFQGLMPEEELRNLILKTYTENNFSHPDITPLTFISDNHYLLELFHGPTCAFKDIALQFLGQLYTWQVKKTGIKPTIIGATSGDTGSAAMMGCKDSGARIFILYPHGRTSDIQRKQMTTLDNPSLHALAIDGTFDDCQKIVKDLFADIEFCHSQSLSAVNSINWFRILAQVVYYIITSLKLFSSNALVNFSVPTGNFGNILAGYIAKKMGAPIGNLIIASNSNDIITRFFETGIMQTKPVCSTLSPSMDIQVSSNFERYLYWLSGSSLFVKDKMAAFKHASPFEISSNLLEKAQKDFLFFRCSDAQTLSTMADMFKASNTLIDPHTAVGIFAARSANLNGPVVSLACAHPAKFPDAVMKATHQVPPQPKTLHAVTDKLEKIIRLPADTNTIRTYILNN